MKAVEVTLSDGRRVLVTAPGKGARNEFLRAMPFFQAFGSLAEAIKSIQGGVIVPIPEIPDVVMDSIDPLIIKCCHVKSDDDTVRPMTAEDMDGLENLFDWFALFTALSSLMPNFPTTTPLPS